MRRVADMIEDGPLVCLGESMTGPYLCEAGCGACEAKALRRLAGMVDEEAAKACEACRKDMAGRLMPEGLSWPRFDDGERVRIGHGWERYGDNDVVLQVCVGEGGFSLHGELIDGYYDRGEPLKRPAPEPPDTWERLEDDATMAPWAYVRERNIDCEDFPQAEAMARDLLRRAKRLAERGLR